MTPDQLTDAEVALAVFAAEYTAAWDEILDRFRTGDLRKRIRTGFGGSLIIANADNGPSTLGFILLTEDGLPASTNEWHTGDEHGDSVYVERWDGPGRRTFHGYVDPVSRKLVQTG